jgi:hypothetical protein
LNLTSSDNSTNPRVGHQITKKQGFYYFKKLAENYQIIRTLNKNNKNIYFIIFTSGIIIRNNRVSISKKSYPLFFAADGCETTRWI